MCAGPFFQIGNGLRRRKSTLRICQPVKYVREKSFHRCCSELITIQRVTIILIPAAQLFEQSFPFRFNLRCRLQSFLIRKLQTIRQRTMLPVLITPGMRQHGADFFFEHIDIAPDLLNPRKIFRTERINLLTPVILARLFTPAAFIGIQFFIKQTATVKCMLTQHALTPCINREYCAVIHRFRGHRQTVSRLFARSGVFIFLQQAAQKRVRSFRITAKHLCCFN